MTDKSPPGGVMTGEAGVKVKQREHTLLWHMKTKAVAQNAVYSNKVDAHLITRIQ